MSDRDGDWALYAMDADGRHQHRVFAAGQADPFGEGLGFGEPAVSPDGRKVLIARDGITVATLATGAMRRIAAGEEASAAWSPDGTRVVYPGRENEGLYVVDLHSGRRRALLGSSRTWNASWSPDGKWIAFVRQIGYGPAELYASHPDGSGLRRVTTYAPGGNRGISWSPDGRFAFVGSREAEQFKHLVVVDVRRRRVRVVESGLEDGTAAWSPDGRTIAFASATRHEARSAIYTVEADGGGRRRLTPRWPPYYDQSPVWSRDGKRLLFVRSAVGGGAAAYVPEVWSTHADGSHQRRLTTAFPRGGGNVEAAWFSGAVHAEPAARTVQTQRGGRIVLRVPFPVDGVSADGARTAIAPVSHAGQEDIIPTPPILVWRPGHGEPRRLVTSGCSVQNLVLAGRRLAFDCDHSFLDEIAQSLWVFDLRTGLPREAFFGHGAVFANGSTLSRTIVLDHIVGGGSLLAFGSEELRPHRALQRALWRIDGFGSIALRARPGTGELVAAGGSRLAIEYPTGAVAITRPDGTLARGLRLRRRPAETSDKLPFLLEGRELLVLDRGHLLAVDTVTGLIRWRRSLPRGAELEDADDGLVVYTVGSSIHMVSRRGETILRTGARRLRRLRADVERPVYAALTPIGLFYSFNVADRRFPGRVVFVPRAQLPG